MKKKLFLQTNNLTEVGEDIGLTEARQMTSLFKQAHPDATQGFYIGRNIIDQILIQPDCVGINFRKCLTETNDENLIYTGVDTNFEDIVQYYEVTNTGNIVEKDGIVAGSGWLSDTKTDDEATRIIFDD